MYLTKTTKVFFWIMGLLLLGVVYSSLQTAFKPKLGAISIPDSPYLFITTLQGNIGSADTSMTLNAGALKNGTSLTGYQCFTLDAGTATAEYTCGTASSTSITNLLRGIDPQNPAATSTALAFGHRRGADVRITDFPILQILKRLSNGEDSYPNPLKMDTSIATSTFSTYNLITKQYADGLALQGAPTATGTTPGVLQLATGIQLSAGTAQVGAYSLVPANSFFRSISQSATTVPVTLANGKIDQSFYDLTQAFTFSGNLTNTAATTTLAATSTKPLILDGVTYSFPFTQGAASTTLVNNGSGVLSWSSIPTLEKSGQTTFNTASNGTTTIAHGLGQIPRFVKVTVTGEINSQANISTGTYIGSTVSTVYLGGTAGAGTDNTNVVHLVGNSSLGANATITTDATNITLVWTSNSGSGTANILWEAYY